jgi:hypothetical protein
VNFGPKTARQPVQTSDVLKILEKLGANLHKVAWDILNNSMTHERELEFGDLLIEAGAIVKAHARNVRRVVLEDKANTAADNPAGDGLAGVVEEGEVGGEAADDATSEP